jgi:hypothetical protein
VGGGEGGRGVLDVLNTIQRSEGHASTPPPLPHPFSSDQMLPTTKPTIRKIQRGVGGGGGGVPPESRSRIAGGAHPLARLPAR